MYARSSESLPSSVRNWTAPITKDPSTVRQPRTGHARAGRTVPALSGVGFALPPYGVSSMLALHVSARVRRCRVKLGDG